MKIGDLVRFRTIEPPYPDAAKFGEGLCTAVYTYENTVEVVWPKKDWAPRTISAGYLEVIR
jgi:hypothetical protein